MGKVVDMPAEVVLVTEDWGVLLLFAIVDDANDSVPEVVDTVAKFVVVELETSTLWLDTLEVVVVALAAQFNLVDTVGVGFAVGEADLEENAATTSDSSM